VRVRSWRLPVHFAPFSGTCRVFLAFARVPSGDRSRSDARHAAPEIHALHSHPTNATNLPFTRQARVGGAQKTRRRCRLPPAVAPSPTIVYEYNSRKSRALDIDLGLRDFPGLPNIYIPRAIHPICPYPQATLRFCVMSLGLYLYACTRCTT